MEIEYTSSRKEVWVWYWRRWIRGDFKKAHLNIALGLFSGMLALQFWHEQLSFRGVLVALGLALLSIVWFPVYPLLMFKPQSRTLRIDKGGLFTTIGKRSGTRAWSEIASIERAGSLIYILVRNGNGFIVPRRAFSSEEHQTEFFLECNGLHEHARAYTRKKRTRAGC